MIVTFRLAFAARLLTLALAALLLVLLHPAGAALAQDMRTGGLWEGTWDTRWPQGGARVVMRQDGERVTGEYPVYAGRIQGVADGNRLTGTWSEPNVGGTFEFVMSADGRSFMGRFGDNEWWTGARVEPDQAGSGANVSQDSPREVLRAFAVLGEAVENGRLEYLDDMQQLLLFPEQDLDKSDELRETRLLWQLLDRFQVRPALLQGSPPGDSYAYRLTRHDGETFTLRFARQDGRWFILVPPEEELAARLKQLLAASGGRPPSARERLLLRNPRDTMEAFVAAMWAGAGGLDEAVSTLDLSELSDVVRDREAVLLAQYLNEVLARIGEVILFSIPNDADSGEPYYHFVHPAGNIVIAPVDGPEGRRWLFTPQTLRDIRQLYAAVEDLPPDRHVLPHRTEAAAIFFRIRGLLRDLVPGALHPLGPLEVWQWVAMVAVFVLALLLALAVGLAARLAWLLSRPRAAEGMPAAPEEPRFLLWGIRLVVFGLVSYGGLLLLGLPDHFASAVKAAAIITLIAGATPIQFWLVDSIRRLLDRYGAISGRGDFVASLLAGAVKVGIVLGNFLLLAEALNIPYSAALAGFGIGGLAVALAARSTLENVIAGFILFADKPLAVGDFCRFGDRTGTVERIGIRATELRTRDRSVISVPNAIFVNMQLENLGRRDRMLLRHNLPLRYETRPDQLRFVLAELRKLLIAHPMVEEERMRVRFAGFAGHALDVKLYAYVRTRDRAEFLAVREDILLRVLDLLEQAGTGLALPAQTLYLGRDHGLAEERGRAAEAQVQGWKAENRLPFPDFTVDEIDALANSLDYPPEGAPRIARQVPEGHLAERRSRRFFWLFGRAPRAT